MIRRNPLKRQLASAIVLSNLCLLSPFPPSAAEMQARFFSADGYRIAEFRAPVPCCVPGAHTVDTNDLVNLLDQYGKTVVLIDVLPTPPRPKQLPATTLWLPPRRNNIPDTVWLPNVGYGRLSEELKQYFRTNLERVTDSRLDRPLVIYCLAECWMSWNAAKRAAEYGYTQVYWYPEGTTAWEKAGLPVARSKPVPIREKPTPSP